MTNLPPDFPEDVLAWIRARVNERGPAPMPDRIFRHARGYHECALRCLELRGPGETFLFQPSLVLMAFAIELYLKSMLAIEKKEAYVHDHQTLYNRICDDLKKRISETYEKRYKGRRLIDDIPHYSNLFAQERYAYETNGERAHDMCGVAQFASALYSTWCELRPDLIQAGVAHERMIADLQGVPIFN